MLLLMLEVDNRLPLSIIATTRPKIVHGSKFFFLADALLNGRTTL
jgi:hypothetical protein